MRPAIQHDISPTNAYRFATVDTKFLLSKHNSKALKVICHHPKSPMGCVPKLKSIVILFYKLTRLSNLLSKLFFYLTQICWVVSTASTGR